MNAWQIALYVVSDGSHVKKRANRIVVVRNDTVVQSVPIMRLECVVLSGRVEVSCAALSSLLDQGIPLVMLTGGGRVRGRLEAGGGRAPDDRFRQLRLASSPTTKLGVARSIVHAKILNQRVLLARRMRRAGHVERARIDDRLRKFAAAVLDAVDLPAAMGYEGAASAAYYRTWRALLGPDSTFAKRDYASTDLLNVLINYCSALLRERVLAAIAVAGLDPTVSFLHTPTRSRPTLAFDLMEEWRPVLLDSVVLSLLGLGAVRASDLEPQPGDRPLLSSQARRAAVDRFQARLTTAFRVGSNARSAPTFDELIQRQVLAFRSTLRDPSIEYQPFLWR